MTVLAPLPGFRWELVRWGAPDARRTLRCSYMPCNADLGHDRDDAPIPLIMWAKDGSCAEFCDDCQVRWWGMTPEIMDEED